MSQNSIIPVAAPVFSERESKELKNVMDSGWITMGKKVEEFEEKFADYVGSKHAIAMFNGTVTLHAALAALGVGNGDEVIVPTLTYISTANVVLYQGAKLILCECDPETYCVTAENIKPYISNKTKAIITVDMNGLPVDYDSINKLANENNIAVIGDSAESLGASYKGKPVGNQALIHSFSFFGNKNVTTGEGGMLTTDDSYLNKELRILRNQGQENRYEHIRLGFNYRMTDLQAAIGIAQLETLNQRIAKKNNVISCYKEFLSDKSKIFMPATPNYVTQHGWYMFAPHFEGSIDRDKVIDDLENAGIQTRVSFPPVHIQPYYVDRFGYQTNDFPISYNAWKQLINLPITPTLSNEQIKFISTQVGESIDRQ